MKRIVAIALVVFMALAVLASCGGGSSNPEGKYAVKTVNGKTVEEMIKSELGDMAAGMDINDLLKLAGIDSLDDYMNLEIKAGGTAVINMADAGSQEGTWKQDGNKITITIGGEPVEFTLSGNELKAAMDGQELVFAKK